MYRCNMIVLGRIFPWLLEKYAVLFYSDLKFILTIEFLSVNFEKTNIKEKSIGRERFCG